MNKEGKIVLSGGQDGKLKMWDARLRHNKSVYTLHARQTMGTGSVSSIQVGFHQSRNYIVTAGADNRLAILDIGQRKEIQFVELPDFPYSLEVFGNVAFCGCGDGSLHVIHVGTGQVLDSSHIVNSAIRTVDIVSSKLVCSGDDGVVFGVSLPT